MAADDQAAAADPLQIIADLQRQLAERDAELAAALDRETATAEVLGVINSSPSDLAPVFDAILEKALELCGAAFGELYSYDGTRFQTAALRGLPAAYAEYRRTTAPIPEPGNAAARILGGEQVVYIPDLTAEDIYRVGQPQRRAMVDLGGARSAIFVALMKNKQVFGALVIYRKEAGAFSDKQIALLQNFAAQAVIAMENARLITETRQRTAELQEALEYQTATSDVLQVISQSGAELEPVLETLVETAVRICEAENGIIFRLRDGNYHLAASVGFSAEFKEHHAQNPTRPGRGTVTGRRAAIDAPAR